VFDLDTHEIFVTRDIVFHEEVFPFESKAKIEEVSAKHSGVGVACDDFKGLHELVSELGQENEVA